METFEFVVTSIARVALKEHVKIQAENVEDAITRIEDNDYYGEDGDWSAYRIICTRHQSLCLRWQDAPCRFK